MRKRISSVGEVDANGLALSEGFVSKVVDLETRKIVGYTQGATFSDESIKAIDKNMREYAILADPEKFGDEAIIVHGVDLICVLLALGVGNEYEEEWGDYGGLVEAIKKDPESVYFFLHPKPVRVEQNVINAAIEDVTK